MSVETYYRIYCNTEGWTYGWSVGEPTECFNNPEHDVNLNSVLELPSPIQPSINSHGIVSGISGIKLNDLQLDSENTIYKKENDPNIYWKGNSEIIVSNIFGTYHEMFAHYNLYSTTSEDYTVVKTFTTQNLQTEHCYKLNWCITWSLDGSFKGYIRILIDSDIISEISTNLRGTLDDRNIYSGFTKKILSANTHNITVECKTTNSAEINISQIDMELTIVL